MATSKVSERAYPTAEPHWGYLDSAQEVGLASGLSAFPENAVPDETITR